MKKILLLMFLYAYCVHGQLTWRKLRNDSMETDGPIRRKDAALGFDSERNRLILFGGVSEMSGISQVLGDTWIYDIDSGQWREVHNTWAPPPRSACVSGVTGEHFYVSTGAGAHTFFADMWRFNLKSETWEELPAQKVPDYLSTKQWRSSRSHVIAPSGRYGAVGGIFDNGSQFYLHGGVSDEIHADTFSYSVTELGWFVEYPDKGPYTPWFPHARHAHAGVMFSPHELLIYGGCQSGPGTGGACPSAESWIYDARMRSWVQLETCASPRMHASLTLLPTVAGRRRALLYGGIETSSQLIYDVTSSLDQVAILDLETREWSLRTTRGQAPSRRAAMATFTGRNGVYMFGGVDVKTGALLNDVHVLLGDALSADKAAVAPAQCGATWFSLYMLHGIFMCMAWGFFLQWGAFIARYSRAATFWYHLHRLMQLFGILLALAGLVAGVLSVRSHHLSHAHALIGLVIMVLGVLQPIIAFWNPKTRSGKLRHKRIRRFLWTLAHYGIGYVSLTLALVNICLGLLLANVHPVLFIAWLAYVAVFLIIRVIAEIRHQHKRVTSAHDGYFETSTGRKYFITSPSSAPDTDRSYTRAAYDNPAFVH